MFVEKFPPKCSQCQCQWQWQGGTQWEEEGQQPSLWRSEVMEETLTEYRSQLSGLPLEHFNNFKKQLFGNVGTMFLWAKC